MVFKPEPPRIRAAHENGKVVAEARTAALTSTVKLFGILALDLLVDSARVRDGLVFQDGRVRRARVFGIKINLARDERLDGMRLPPSSNWRSTVNPRRLQHLREDFRENDALRKILRADDGRARALR